MMRFRLPLLLLALLLVLVVIRLIPDGEEPWDAQLRLAHGFFYPWSVESIDAIEIIYPQRSFRVDKVDERWMLTVPMRDYADEGTINHILSTLETQRVDRWLPPPRPEAEDSLGLADPKISVRLHRAEEVDSISFGKLDPVAERLNFQASWTDSLGLVSTLLRTWFMKGRQELSDRRPLPDLDMKQVERITISNGRGRFDLVPDGAGWNVKAPEIHRADRMAVKLMLAALTDRSIVEFAELDEEHFQRYGFGRPRARVEIYQRGHSRPILAELGKGFWGLNYLRADGRNSAFLLDSLHCVPLQESYSFFLSTQLFRFLPAWVTKIELPTGRVLERGPGGPLAWISPSGEREDADLAADVIDRLSNLSTGRMEALIPRGDQMKLWGLASPRHYCRLSGPRGDWVLVLGSTLDGRTCFMREDYSAVYSLPAEEFQVLFRGGAPAH